MFVCLCAAQVNKLLQLVGLAVTAVFIYKITTDPEER